MPRYIALTYTQDVDWSHADQGEEMAEYVWRGESRNPLDAVRSLKSA